MTEEQINILKEFESNYTTAIRFNYTRNLTNNQLDRLLAVYEAITGKKYVLCKHCSNSVIDFLKVIGKMYFNNTAIVKSQIEKSNENGKSKKNLRGRKNK